MKRLLFILCIVLSGTSSFARQNLFSVDIDVSDRGKLQRGARLFMNYCSGCHALRYMRYNRMAEDLGLTTFDGKVDKDLLTNNLMFTASRIQDPIVISMPEQDARQWFGKLPPDLSLSAREHGVDWVYTYLKSFYKDTSRPFGANNALMPDVAMPNVLAPLQGEVIARKAIAAQKNLNLFLIDPGEMTAMQFDSALQDLVTFLAYVSEPAQMIRYRLGKVVLIFLGIFAILAYQLKKLYWRDIR